MLEDDPIRVEAETVDGVESFDVKVLDELESASGEEVADSGRLSA